MTYADSGLLVAVLGTSLEREEAAETVAGSGSGDPRENLILAEFSEVGGGSTAWINLVMALDSADNEIGEVDLLVTKGDARNVSAYWDWAWNTYQVAMSEVGPAESEARRLSHAYNLDDMDVCGWCETPAVNGGTRRFEKADGALAPYHLACLAEMLREQGL